MSFTRRRLLAAAAGFPALAQSGRPVAAQGSMAGDVVPGRAMIWSRADRPSRMRVRWHAGDGRWREVQGPHCLDVTDFTGRLELTGLPAGRPIEYEVTFESLGSPRATSEPVKGAFRAAPAPGADVSFCWSGDTVGQGWGINPERGGMRIYETMRGLRPDFFIHSGDTIYADGPVVAEVKLADGSVWRNLTTPEKSKVAETLGDFRGAHRYNLLDANVRRFHSEVAQVWQWDDHEVTNNWSPSKSVDADARYTEKSVPLLVARGTRAFLEYSPIRHSAVETERVYRRIPYGPLADVFVVDLRSYRGPNTYNRQESEGADTAYLGKPQIAWLERGLRNSTALWKVIACDMPIGLQVGDGKDAEGRPMFENGSNGNGPALGRELETARILRFIKQQNIRNVVWFTADTHYTAAHFYDPKQARFSDFLPFWEFMSGPLNAGTFGPGATDDTFGIQVMYQKHPPAGQANLPPSAGMQFFGHVRISAKTRAMTVDLRDVGGAVLYTKELEAEA